MATLWIQTAALVVLLVVSCPSSQATALQHLCGAHLVDALYLVCGDRGFHYRPENNESPVQGNGESAVGGNEGTAFGEQMGMVERCCHRPCTLFDLQFYCL
ncbi:insulin [Kryptolebias marmoratus]|uniref:insulin n=1 Tax=Kryptolebias marmoratus TaxID=37003 RepID=UPI0007F8980B|nr:insulin [Kryptolebias marmoratus]XP_037834838.1 insulin [Kryptolebias marmoratus]